MLGQIIQISFCVINHYFFYKLSSKIIFYFYEQIWKLLLSTRDAMTTLGIEMNVLQILKHYVN